MATVKKGGKAVQVKYARISESELVKQIGASGVLGEIKHVKDSAELEAKSRKNIVEAIKGDAGKFAEYVKAKKGVSDGDKGNIGLTPTILAERTLARLIKIGYKAKVEKLAKPDGTLPDLLIGASNYALIYSTFFWEAMGKVTLPTDYAESLVISPKGDAFDKARLAVNDAANIAPRKETVKPAIFRQAISNWFVSIKDPNELVSLSELKAIFTDISAELAEQRKAQAKQV
jgi:hypothetical protein